LRDEIDTTQAMKVTGSRVRVTLVAVQKAVSITYFECVSAALVTQH
jgi:hypothetical protein